MYDVELWFVLVRNVFTLGLCVCWACKQLTCLQSAHTLFCMPHTVYIPHSVCLGVPSHMHIHPYTHCLFHTQTHVMQQPLLYLSHCNPHILYMHMHIVHVIFKSSAGHVPGRRRQAEWAIEGQREGRECTSGEQGEFSSQLLNVDLKPAPFTLSSHWALTAWNSSMLLRKWLFKSTFCFDPFSFLHHSPLLWIGVMHLRHSEESFVSASMEIWCDVKGEERGAGKQPKEDN